MTTLRSLAAVLAFRASGLRTLAAKRAVIAGCIYLGAGFLVFVLIRNAVYAALRDHTADLAQPELFGSLLQLNVLQLELFLSLVYIPAVICLSNALAGDGLGLSFSREEYRAQLSALFPLWGALFLLSAPLQWLLPQFLVLGYFGISLGLLFLILLMVVYTVWSIRELNYISFIAALAVFALSWITFPLFYIISMFLVTLPFFVMIPLLYLGYQRIHSFFAGKEDERAFQRHLHNLSLNPQDADAQCQLGLIQLRRGNLDASRLYFEDACRMQPEDPEYHYYLGRVFEAKEDWEKALEQYEETYRRNTEFGQGDIYREVGKGYLHTGRLEKALEFLRFFLNSRSSDPEGRYWLAVTLNQQGKVDEARVQLNTILEQARSQPRFFRKEKREWVYRSRMLLRS